MVDRDQLITDHIGHVRRLASKMLRKFPRHVQHDDFVSAGCIGLVQAADTFDPTKNLPFWAFAKYRVWGAILDSTRVGPGRKGHKAQRDAGLLLEVEIDYANHCFVEDEDPTDKMQYEQWYHVINTTPLSSRHRRLFQYHLQGYTYLQISKIFGVNESRVCQLYWQAVRLVRDEARRRRIPINP